MTRGSFQRGGFVKTLSLLTLKGGKLWFVHVRKGGKSSATTATKSVKPNLAGAGFLQEISLSPPLSEPEIVPFSHSFRSYESILYSLQ